MKLLAKSKVIINKIFIYMFKCLPIQNVVVFDNFDGQGFAGNPKYISRELYNRKKFDKYIWLVDEIGKYNDIPTSYIQVKKDSIKAMYYISTSKVWVFNTRKGKLRKRKGQLYIQSWHALIGIKKTEGEVKNGVTKGYQEFAISDSKNMDAMISTCRRYSEIMKQYYWIDDCEKIQEFGSPEYDYTFYAGNEEKTRIQEKLGTNGKKVLLYAPTFRKDKEFNYFQLEFSNVLNALREKFSGEWVLVCRLHPNLRNTRSKEIIKELSAIDATDYEDIQELCILADAVITDYSSAIFGSAIKKIPGFMYAPDLNEYINDRDFEFSFSELPFTISCTQEELFKNISEYDADLYSKAVDQFMSLIGIVYDGKASQRTAEWIIQQLS